MTYPSIALHDMAHSLTELHKPLHLEGAINHMKQQKDMTPEDEPLRLEGVQYATGEERLSLLKVFKTSYLQPYEYPAHSSPLTSPETQNKINL